MSSDKSETQSQPPSATIDNAQPPLQPSNGSSKQRSSATTGQKPDGSSLSDKKNEGSNTSGKESSADVPINEVKLLREFHSCKSQIIQLTSALKRLKERRNAFQTKDESESSNQVTNSRKRQRDEPKEDNEELDDRDAKRKKEEPEQKEKRTTDEAPKKEEKKKPMVKSLRNNRMFGMMLGHLKQSRNELKDQSKTIQRRERIEKKISEKEKQEKLQIREKEMNELEEKIKEKETKLEDTKKELIALEKVVKVYTQYEEDTRFNGYLQTKTTPLVYFLPSKLKSFQKDTLQSKQEHLLKHKDQLIHVLRSNNLFSRYTK